MCMFFKGDITFPKSDTYDIAVDADIMLNRNNRSQINAIRTALQERFTLIQGPPGMCQLPSFFSQVFKHNYVSASYILWLVQMHCACIVHSVSCVLLVKWKFKPIFCSFADTEVHSTYKTEASKLHIVCPNSLLFALLLLRLASSNVKRK